MTTRLSEPITAWLRSISLKPCLSTGFKTTRKELLQVVRLFDPNYEGRMDYCRFISCLRSIPGPNEDEEFNIMAAKWAKAGPRYKVEPTDPEYPVSVLYKTA